jgi:hypothetical protein
VARPCVITATASDNLMPNKHLTGVFPSRRNCYRHVFFVDSFKHFVFSVTVPYDNDVLYIAYHYPYTYSQLMVRSSLVLLFKCTQICFLLQTDVVTWLRTPFPIGYPSYSMDRLRISTLCRSPCGNPVPLLLIDYDGDAKVI